MTDHGQLALPVGAIQNRGLFSDHFFSERLAGWPEFADLDVGELHGALTALWKAERQALPDRNEAQTEDRFIQPVLHALGFAYTVQAGLRFAGGRRQPDYALFLTDAERAAADAVEGEPRYARAAAVADAKKFDRPLDVRAGRGNEAVDPVAQIINYVLITKSDWGVLTNGRKWRLYSRRRGLTEGACYEVDLVELLEAGQEEDLRWFAAFFGADAFRRGTDGRSFLDRALDESVANAVQVGGALEQQVFGAVPLLAEGLLGDAERSGENLAAAFDNSLVFLYRLLFCLYAEARELLPVDAPHYLSYSLRNQKDELARDINSGRVFSRRSDDLYNDLRGLFRIVDRGDDQLGVPEYNGGLFSADKHPYFAERFVPDDLLAQALDRLYRVAGEFVDYGNLSIRHLGTIYERLLAFRLTGSDDGLALTEAKGRHQTGSYFTPAHVVNAIVERTLDPILSRRSADVAGAGKTGSAALESLLDIRVLDPAMGSGHFLVAVAEYIAQAVATDPSYIDSGSLDLPEIKGMVAERCVYGVDVNPMAVELAQLSLWLATVRRGEPLTFLNNLRVGNSLVGVSVADLLAGGETVFADRLSQDAGRIIRTVAEIGGLAGRNGDDVHEKERLAASVAKLRGPLEEHADDTIAPEFADGAGRFFHWDLEFPEVFLAGDGTPRPDGGFDALVGNPPYVRIQELGRALADWCRAHYESASGSFDVYVPFLERGLQLLGPAGRLGFIVPNKLLKLDYGKRLRQRLADDRLVDEVIDFGDAQVFEGATNYTCVLFLDRGGREEFAYRRVRGDTKDVEDALTDVKRVVSETFQTSALGAGPWVLAAGEEARLLRTAAEGAARLDEVTEQIFQGLITSADPVYILEDRGSRGGRRIVYSKASGEELELEPDLLRPLASGVDVDRYAFRSLRHLLLFPYGRGEDGAMRLLPEEKLAQLPATLGYLHGHEVALRARELGKMDHLGWYGYVYPKSLGAHERTKLGVAATVSRLEIAADPGGDVYFHNVRVNGILPTDPGPTIWSLLPLLNSRLLDYVFRRGAAEHQNAHYAANKQFIAPLPIQLPPNPEEVDALGQRLYTCAAGIARERRGFFDWLENSIGARLRDLAGSTQLLDYEHRTTSELVNVLQRNDRRTSGPTGSRAFREDLEREHRESVERLVDARADLARDERTADELVYELYRLTSDQRALVDAEYPSP